MFDDILTYDWLLLGLLLLSAIVFFSLVLILRRIRTILWIIDPLTRLREETTDEKFLKKTKEEKWVVEKDNYTAADSKLRLEPVEESVEEPEQIVIQKPPLVDLSDKFVDDVLQSVKEVVLSEQTAKKERRKAKIPIPIKTVVKTEETAEKEPEVVIETEPEPHM